MASTQIIGWFQLQYAQHNNRMFNGWFHTDKPIETSELIDFINQRRQVIMEQIQTVATEQIPIILEKESHQYLSRWRPLLDDVWNQRQELDAIDLAQLDAQNRQNTIRLKRQTSHTIKGHMHDLYQTSLYPIFVSWADTHKYDTLERYILDLWQSTLSQQCGIDFHNYLPYSYHWDRDRNFLDSLYSVTEYQRHSEDLMQQIKTYYSHRWINIYGTQRLFDELKQELNIQFVSSNDLDNCSIVKYQ